MSSLISGSNIDPFVREFSGQLMEDAGGDGAGRILDIIGQFLKEEYEDSEQGNYWTIAGDRTVTPIVNQADGVVLETPSQEQPSSNTKAISQTANIPQDSQTQDISQGSPIGQEVEVEDEVEQEEYVDQDAETVIRDGHYDLAQEQYASRGTDGAARQVFFQVLKEEEVRGTNASFGMPPEGGSRVESTASFIEKS